MIVDKIANLSRYDYVPFVSNVVEFLKSNDYKNMENGKYDIGDDCYVVISEYLTNEIPSEVIFECHREYIDLQMLASGEESMLTQAIDLGEENKPYNKDIEAELLTASWYNTINLYDGNFVILFPNDLHSGSYVAEEQVKVKKLVFKLKI